MIVKIQQAENSVERVENEVITTLYNAHVNGNISQELDNNNQKIGLIGTIQADGGYEIQVSTLTSAYPKFHISVGSYLVLFEDPKAQAVCATYFGNGTGCSISDLANADFTKTVNGVDFGTAFKNAGVVKFNEFRYCTGVTDTSVSNTWPFRNNTTLDEFTLPTSCKTIATNTFADSPQRGSIAPKINGMENITYLQSFAFWNWGSKQADKNVSDARRFQIDWRKINGIWNDMYAASNVFKGDVILPKYPTDSWTSSRDFSIFNDGRGQYITKIIFPETFTCNNLGLHSTNSLNTIIFLTQTPANGEINLWRNQNWGVGDRHLYVPRTLYNSLDLSATAVNYVVTYSSVLKIKFGGVPEPLDNYANISDDNKDELVSYGCTATGSTGNWTIKAPGET